MLLKEKKNRAEEKSFYLIVFPGKYIRVLPVISLERERRFTKYLSLEIWLPPSPVVRICSSFYAEQQVHTVIAKI